MCIKNVKNMQFNFVVIFILLNKIVVLAYNFVVKFCHE